MNSYDRRRLVLASIFTVAALPALWIINRDDAGSAAPALGAAGVPQVGANQAPSTSTYTPDAPIFLNGPPSGADPAVVDIIIPRGPVLDRGDGQGQLQAIRGPQQEAVHHRVGALGEDPDSDQYRQRPDHHLSEQHQHTTSCRRRHRAAHRCVRVDQRSG